MSSINRFWLAIRGEYWLVWDSEECVVVDEDPDIGEMQRLAHAMNSLDRQPS